MPKWKRDTLSAADLRAGLANVDLFTDLDTSILDDIESRTHVKCFDARQTLCRSGDESREVFFILEGWVRATVFSPNGREVAFRDLHEGDSFGELAAIDGMARSADVITQEPSVVAVLAARDFMDIIRSHPKVAVNTLCKLTMWIRGLSERIYEFNAPVSVRVCSELSRMASAAMISDEIARLRPAPKHAEIAARVNTHREAVTRTFGELQRAGILKKARGELIITDVKALEEYIAKLEREG